MATKGPDKESCTCPICMYIMIEPVTMPCKHTLCMICYRQTVAQSNLLCPICRQRISVWARRAARTNSLVDQKKWLGIQRAFPQKVKKRMEGIAGGVAGNGTADDDEDDSDDQDCETYLRKLKELSKPGEIHEEYEAAMRKLQQQRELEAKKEEEASAALIQALQEEEAREVERLRREREDTERLGLAMAQQLQEVSFEKLNSSGVLNSPALFLAHQVPHRYLDTTAKQEQQKEEMSPYPYACISPVDKIFYGLSALGGLAGNSPRARSQSVSSDEAPGLREEHSYTTASASVVDLTNAAVSGELCRERADVPTYDLLKVKSEPEDIFGPGPSGLNKFVPESPLIISTLSRENNNTTSGGGGIDGQVQYLCPTAGNFKPIVAHLRTPPRPQADGTTVDVPVLSITPRRLALGDSPGFVSSPIGKSLKTQSPKMKSATGMGKTTAAALMNKRAEEVLRNSAKARGESSGNPGCGSEQIKDHDNIVTIHPSNSKLLNPSTEPSEKFASEARSVCMEDESPYADQAQESNTNTKRTSRANSRTAVDNRSDQENCADVWDSDSISSPVLGLTGSIVRPLNVSGSSNKPGNKHHHTKASETSDSDLRVKGKSVPASVNKSSSTCTNKTQPASSKKSRAKGKQSEKGAANTTLDSFVQRKKRTFSESTTQDIENSSLTQEEKDHLLALQLQEMYENLDKSGIDVDRFKGSMNEYSFRKKRKV
ncbi:hypothetical protein EGW08_021102 [Elysia chlorotica]|uniref:RING-type E3 ubiquitin transferase n=1 Tax=Elysia chlorotica TaxID=188477 RepID=A0A433SPI6_ELYCH|nr:hypothetical protein EGW08_021102 [Elysia chlorotica]